MRFVIGADHRGAEVAEHVMDLLKSTGHSYIFHGPQEEGLTDYPDIAWITCNDLLKGNADLGILVSGSGIGMTMVANKMKNIRAVLAHDEWTASVSREHHDSNILCLPADMIGIPHIDMILKRWLEAEFLGGRHERRISKMAMIHDDIDPRMHPDTA